jgi:hypothetical protein
MVMIAKTVVGNGRQIHKQQADTCIKFFVLGKDGILLDV